jgi:hypothetical protein
MLKLYPSPILWKAMRFPSGLHVAQKSLAGPLTRLRSVPEAETTQIPSLYFVKAMDEPSGE